MILRCYTGKHYKPAEEFSKDARMKRGYQGSCKECCKIAFKKWYESKKIVTQAQKRQYKKDHSDKINANNAKRRAARLQRTPNWLTLLHLSQIEMFYASARALTKELGIEFDVDHIVPLQGKNVSGLHVPWNLQVLPAVENGSKSNKVPL